MLENISSLIYVLGRQIFNVLYFVYIFYEYLRIPKALFWSLIAAFILGEWYYLLELGHHLTVPGQYLASLLYVLTAVFCYNHKLVKRLLLLLFLGNIAFLLQTLALVTMEQCSTSLPPITLGAIVLILANLVTIPSIKKFLKLYRQNILPCENYPTLHIAALILFINFLGTIVLYDFHSARDWSLLAGRCLNIIPAIIFIQIIFHLIREQELNSNLNAKLKYLEQLRQSEKKYFDYIIDSWKQTRRLRHDLRHLALLMQEYQRTQQYDKLKQALQELIRQAENKS